MKTLLTNTRKHMSRASDFQQLGLYIWHHMYNVRYLCSRCEGVRGDNGGKRDYLYRCIAGFPPAAMEGCPGGGGDTAGKLT